MASRKITAETVEKIAGDVLDLRMSPTEQDQAAGLLTSLLADMAAMRRMDVGTAEPATTYSAIEPGT